MATVDFSKYFLYRWRYVIGYTAIGLLLAGLLVFSGIFLPGGLSQAEIAATVKSASLSLSDPSTLVTPDLPYYAFQAILFAIFGISTFTIKLPSLILALISALGLIALLRRWFTPNIAVLASFIAVTTGQFLFIAQTGTPSILYIFWPVVLLLLGTQITRVKRARFLWKILFAIAAALSLYTPLSIYPLIAIGLAIALHPHLRTAVRRLRKSRLIATSLVFAALVAPLVYAIAAHPSLAVVLLGIPTTWPPDFSANALSLLQQYFFFWQPSSEELMIPVFGLGSAILILLGLYRLIRTRETTRSYLIISWIVCLTPILLLNPAFTSVTYVPSVLMLAAGLTSLIGYWYRLFPLNPYARIAGLVPIIILVTALIFTGLARYSYGYHYSPAVAPLFSEDLSLLPKETNILVVSPDERAFYDAVADSRQDLVVTTDPQGNSFTATRAADVSSDDYTIKRIITNQYREESDRFYIYERSPQD